LDKPLVIGEFASESSEGESVEELYEYAYTNGYSVSIMEKSKLSYKKPYVVGL